MSATTRVSAIAPFRILLRASYAEHQVMSTLVLNADVVFTRSAIRRAATEVNVGAHIRDIPLGAHHTLVTYVAKPRRVFA